MNNLTEFTLELAQQLYHSQKLVDFDWAWQVLGYSRKDSAKRMLAGYFEQNFDYFVQHSADSSEPLPHEVFHTSEENSKGGRPSERIYLTVDCFKEMGMLSKSFEGKQIRKYFLQCEVIAKLKIQDVQNLPQPQQPPVSATLETIELLGEMARVVESFIAGSTSLNKAIHTSIHQQSETLRLAFENLRRLHDKTAALPATVPQSLTDDIGNLVKLTPRLTTIERRQAVISFLDLIDNLPEDSLWL